MDPYMVLGLSRGASMQVIRSRYKELSFQLHPDKAGELSTGAFQRVNAAYEKILASKQPSVENAPENHYNSYYDSDADEDYERGDSQYTRHQEEFKLCSCGCGCGGPSSLSKFHKRSDRQIVRMSVAEDFQNKGYAAVKENSQEKGSHAVGNLNQERSKHAAAKKLNQIYRERFRNEHKAAKDVKRYEQELERAAEHASKSEYILAAPIYKKRLERKMNTLSREKKAFDADAMLADCMEQRMSITVGKNAAKAQRVLEYKMEKEQAKLSGKKTRQSRLKGQK